MANNSENNVLLRERGLISAPAEKDDEIDLLKLWHSIWQRKFSIITLVFAVMLVATLIVLVVTPIYRATATLLIEQKAAKVVSIEQVYGIDSGTNEYLQTQFELLKSRALAERVVKKLNLLEHPEFDPRQQEEPLINFGAIIAALDLNKLSGVTLPDSLENEEDAAEAKLFDEVLRKFMDSVSVSQQGKSQLVTVSVEMADGRMAARAANELAHGFIESQLEASMEMSATASEWMNTRLDELRGKLKEAEDKLQAFREAENLVDVDGVSTIVAGELSLTADRMIDARRQRAEAESQYNQVKSMQNNWERLASLPAVLGHPLIQQFKADEAKARAKVEELSKRYGARHPAMEAASSELSAASASLRGKVEQIVAGIERNYQLAVANENSLRASFNANKAQIQQISSKEFKLRELQREVDANRALYDTFMTRFKETSATSDLENANARIVDKATPPQTPVKPKKALIVLIAGILASFIGIGLSLLLDILNNTFKNTEEVESRLNLPVLGVLPMLKKQERSGMAQMFVDNKNRPFCESIRTIRTGLVLSNMETDKKVTVITSSIPAEGKSTVSTNLAFALGQVERVLLIDADLRRPTLAKNFNFPVGTPGLANLIAGTAKLEDCIQNINGLDMMGAGLVPPNPLELLSSSRFNKILELLSSKYDHIVIDSPPTQAVSDAVVLATHATALIYIIKSDSTAIPLVEKGIGTLLQNNAPVVGVVLNQVDIEKSKKNGYSYTGYYDYYGYSNDSKA